MVSEDHDQTGRITGSIFHKILIVIIIIKKIMIIVIIIMSLFYEDDIFIKQCSNLTYGPH